MKKIFKLSAVFILLSVILYSFFYLDKKYKMDGYLEATTSQIVLEYAIIYAEYTKLSEIFFTTKINTKEVIDIFKYAYISNYNKKNHLRKKLHEQLEDTYSFFKQFNVKQLHFYLPNNKSYLRFYKPYKDDNDLSFIRQTVKYVNQTKKSIDGFENRKFHSGFRFIFPMHDRTNFYIGSVEFSFSTSSFMKDFMSHYKLEGDFLISKDISKMTFSEDELKNYKQSPIKDFYIENSQYHDNKEIKNNKLHNLNKSTITYINTNILQEKAFSIYDNKTRSIVTVVPVKHPLDNNTVSAIVFYSPSKYIENELNDINILITILISLVIVVIYSYITKIYDKNLQRDLKILLKKKTKAHDKLLSMFYQQSKMAEMGDMIAAIAHQWRQPLGIVNGALINIKEAREADELDDKYLNKMIEVSNKNIQFMSHTIDDFRNYFQPNKQKVDFDLVKTINETISIVDAQLKYMNIQVVFYSEDIFKIYGYPNEFKQVLINIISNAKDAIKENNIKNGRIQISIIKDDENIIITIEDNAGGIPSKIINRIFDPYFTTKDPCIGTGIGLYMSKMIIEQNMGGKISAQNSLDGSIFMIVLKYEEV